MVCRHRRWSGILVDSRPGPVLPKVAVLDCRNSLAAVPGNNRPVAGHRIADHRTAGRVVVPARLSVPIRAM